MPQNNATRMANQGNAAQGLEAWRAFQEETKHPLQRTEELLMQLLHDNQDTEYGRRHGFALRLAQADGRGRPQ